MSAMNEWMNPAPIFADSAASVRMLRTQSDTLKKHEIDDDDLKKMYTIPVERSWQTTCDSIIKKLHFSQTSLWFNTVV